jgi:hypothetical protein
MDCEKFEATMLDELYGELDELTLAASRRHVGGCARCAALIGGLRATRKLIALPPVEPSAGFEARILEAARAAEATPKLGFAQVISWAGRWAMRPQTAMAAVFLLILGTSSVLFSRRAPKSATADATSSFTVTENGAPALASGAPLRPPTLLPVDEKLDPRVVAAAHGPSSAGGGALPLAPARASSPAAADPGPEAVAQAATPETRSTDEAERLASPRARAAAPAAIGPRRAPEGAGLGGLGGGATPAPPSAAEQDLSGAVADRSNAATGASDFAKPPSADAVDPFKAARRQYAGGDYAGAARAFDALAATGDTTAALWAARAVRDGAGGCGAAAPRFDQVASAAWGSVTGYDATLEGAQCYARLGQAGAAGSRYNRLLTVASYAARAQAGINSMSQVAAKARPAAARPAEAAPASPPAAAPGSGP